MEAHERMSVHEKQKIELRIQSCLDTQEFQKPRWIPDLWETDFKFSPKWVQWKCMVDNSKQWVRCSQPFQQVVTRVCNVTVKNPPNAILKLLEKSLPLAHKIFDEALSPHLLLQCNDYCMEKAYVYAIYQVSYKLGSSIFANGIYGWPPPAPPDVIFDETHWLNHEAIL